MFKNQFRCKLCDRPMPPRVYEAHLKKSHTPEEVAGQIEKNEKEIKEAQGAFNQDLLSLVKDNTPPELPKSVIKEFDWGEVYPCSWCGEEFPAKAMSFHSWVKHRV